MYSTSKQLIQPVHQALGKNLVVCTQQSDRTPVPYETQIPFLRQQQTVCPILFLK